MTAPRRRRTTPRTEPVLAARVTRHQGKQPGSFLLPGFFYLGRLSATSKKRRYLNGLSLTPGKGSGSLTGLGQKAHKNST